MKKYQRKQIKKSLKNIICLDPENKYVVFSDLHLGIGDYRDDSLKNMVYLQKALSYYYSQGYFLVLLGDIFEVAENKDIEAIKYTHDDIMWELKRFYDDNRLVYVKGNHDMFLKPKQLFTRYDKYSKSNIEFLDNINFYDCACIPGVKNNEKDIFLFHGHQAYFIFSNTFINRIIVWLGQHVWSKIENNIYNGLSNERVNIPVYNSTDKVLSEWGKENNSIVIAGHTHEVQYGIQDYFNVGGGVLPRFLSCAEILEETDLEGHTARNIKMVKWNEVYEGFEGSTQKHVYFDRTLLGSF